jgi:probable rRNA maturation factor
LKLNVTIQFAHRRLGVPHPRSLTEWASAAAAQQSPQTTADLTIRVVGAAESRRLNRTWRGKDKPTNVLSFPADFPEPHPGRAGAGRAAAARASADNATPLGDLAICAPVVAREAREQGKMSTAHWAHMVIHGVLHLLGYDHENDRDAELMEAREVKLLARFGYPDPYA